MSRDVDGLREKSEEKGECVVREEEERTRAGESGRQREKVFSGVIRP